MFSFASFMGDIILACQFLMVEINENKTSVVIKRCPGGNRTEVVIYTWWFRIFVERSSPFRKMSPLSNTPGKTNIEPAPVILPILHGTSEDCPNKVDLFQEVRIPSFHPMRRLARRKKRRGLWFFKGWAVETSGFCPVDPGCMARLPWAIFRGWHVSNPFFVGSISATFTRNRELYTWRQAK